MHINTVCKYYKGSSPCEQHKKDGRLCEACEDYNPINKNILIIKLGAAGDVIRTTSILKGLKEKYSNYSIDWVTKENVKPLLINIPLIDNLYIIEKNYLEFILSKKYNIAVCLDADKLSASIMSIVDAEEKIGFYCDEKGRILPCDKKSEKLWLLGLNDKLKKDNEQSYISMIYEMLGLNLPINPPIIYQDNKAEKFVKNFYDKNNLGIFKKIVGINTGAGNRWQLKKWTSEGYIELIKKLSASHPDVGLLLFGGETELEFNKRIKEKVGNKIIDTGNLNSIAEFTALINLTDIFFTPDSLGFHIASGLRKKTIVIVGPTSSKELDLFDNGEIITSDIDCLCCYLNKCNKNINCMNSISSEQVYEIISKYI